jgi:hypothetical protein
MSRANRKSNRRRVIPKKKAAPKKVEDTRLKLLFIASSLPKSIAECLQKNLPQYGGAEFSVDEDVSLHEEGLLHADVTLGQHQIKMVGFSAPVPEKVGKMAMDCANWSREEKQEMRAHTHHMLVYYEGGSSDVAEQFLALYTLAACLLDDGLLGIMDTAAWNCVPVHAIKNLMLPELRESCLEDLPLPIWTGFAKIFVSSDEVWLCSKGFHRFGVMDFAWFGTMADVNEVFDLFNGLFSYVRNDKAKLKAGDTAQFGDNLILRFVKLTDYHDYLEGPLGTLVIERLDPSNFH